MKPNNQNQKSHFDKPIPIIDVFAGPGGLGEGFSSVLDAGGRQAFQLALSIEKDAVAHKTLALRAAFRSFGPGGAPQKYYDYIKGDVPRESLDCDPVFNEALKHSFNEAKCEELGPSTHSRTDAWIKSALRGHEDWILIGGPPCQAYSMAGRSRLRPVDAEKFEKDEKHFLYKEYLRIIRSFRPAVFVMENVKGILSSTHGGSKIFGRILEDLSEPSTDLRYKIHSLVDDTNEAEKRPIDYVIRSEQYGVPQARHRVILLGVREDFAKSHPMILAPSPAQVSVNDVIHDLPPLRSRLSKEQDSVAAWSGALAQLGNQLSKLKKTNPAHLDAVMKAISGAEGRTSTGDRFLPSISTLPHMQKADNLANWYRDTRLGGVLQHEARGHMRTDLHRYLFAASYAAVFSQSPNLKTFPRFLLPNHRNAEDEDAPFLDRFRVQCRDRPSTTVVSHIAKDGHYYIHPDPSQCRSLTVREAARLQTFPDNYFFEGNRTQQYHQVGNAVPPWLARQIGRIVLGIFEDAKPADQVG